MTITSPVSRKREFDCEEHPERTLRDVGLIRFSYERMNIAIKALKGTKDDIGVTLARREQADRWAQYSIANYNDLKAASQEPSFEPEKFFFSKVFSVFPESSINLFLSNTVRGGMYKKIRTLAIIGKKLLENSLQKGVQLEKGWHDDELGQFSSFAVVNPAQDPSSTEASVDVFIKCNVISRRKVADPRPSKKIYRLFRLSDGSFHCGAATLATAEFRKELSAAFYFASPSGNRLVAPSYHIIPYKSRSGYATADNAPKVMAIGELYEGTFRGRRLNIKSHAHAMLDVSRGVYQISSKKCVHSDIKIDNIFYKDNPFFCVLGDLEFVVQEGMNCTAGDRMTAAPEVFKNALTHVSRDIYSLGHVGLTLLGVKFDSKYGTDKHIEEESKKYLSLKRTKIETSEGSDKDIKLAFFDLYARCMAFDPAARPKIEEVIEELIRLINSM